MIRVGFPSTRARSATAWLVLLLPAMTVLTSGVASAAPPAITTQPASQTIVSGTTATLSVTASGTAPLGYQWYLGTSGTTTSPIAGATMNSFKTPALTSTTSYWVRVSNADGHADSSTATITIATAPTITTQPASQTIGSGTTATLSVTASGTAPLGYQWYVGTSGTTTNPIGGATASSFTTPALTGTTSYWVRVSNVAGHADSSTATITIATAPTITTQPASQTIGSGTTATLSVTASGTAPLGYQWYVGTSGTTTNPIGGATGSSFTTPALTGTTSYWVRVSNVAGHADSSTATITIATPPTITAQPASQTIVSGTTATLSVTASGTAPLGYQWYLGTSGSTTNPIGGATGSSYTTPGLTSTTSYWVRVSNVSGHADSNTATITMATPPTITTQPASQTIVSGTTATLSVTASGTAPLGYQWYIGASGTTTSPIGGATGPSYTTPGLTTTTNYWVRVSNIAGHADSSTATITIATPPSITTQPASQTILSGTAATLSVTASGTAPLGYQWYSGTSGTTTSPIGGATGPSYTTPALTTTTSYWVRVSNVAGHADSNTATITVVSRPTITTQPANQDFISGTAATLSVTASGTTPLGYQWYIGTSGTITSPIGGATGSSYTTPALTTTTSYWVRVSNIAGTADSNTATMTVVTPPTITTQPANRTIAPGRAATLSVMASGTAPLYQWYIGTSGTLTSPISGATGSSYTTPALTSTTSYWVRVSNVLGTANSSTATVTVGSVVVSFDGDTKADLAVFRPSNGIWYIRYSSFGYSTASAGAFQWGLPGDIPIAGDFDGDGKTDLTVFRPSNGTWYIRYSSLGYSIPSAGLFQWGLPGDIPVAGDFDGDGKTELAVFRPSNGTWYVRYSSLGYSIPGAGVFQWGLPGDSPVTGDFDGDGITDLAVFRPSNGTWYIRYSSLGYNIAKAGVFQWGLPGDSPVTGDFDGDGQTDLAVYRPSIGGWFIRYSSRGYSTANFDYFQWGLPGDVPIAADFDGDGNTELTVFRPLTGEWFIRYSSLGYGVASHAEYQWGLPGDAVVH